jgi:8-oxo-dGTP pyrophosphatase MutT (NUDIX family)
MISDQFCNINLEIATSFSKLQNNMQRQTTRQQKPFVPPTAGVIVINQKDTNNNQRVLLVETKAQGNWGFPKGSREKGETSIDNAIREMNEESGLNRSNIQLIESSPNEYKYFDEWTPRNTLSCRYFLATLQQESELKALNPLEVLQFGYYSIEKALELLKPSRQLVLREAIQYLENH